MTINKYLQQLSPEDLAYVKQYHHEIQPFRVLPSSTLEFDGQFNGDGETIFAEIDLNEDHTVDDVFCTCGAGGLCVHLTAMMYDMVERDTIRNRQNRQRLDRHGTIVVGSCETFHHYNVQGVK